MQAFASLFTRKKKPLSSAVRQNNTSRGNYEYAEFEGIGNTNFSNANPALRNLTMKRAVNRAVNRYEKTKRNGFLQRLKKGYDGFLLNPPSARNKNIYRSARNNTLKTLKSLKSVGKNYPDNIALLESLNFASLPVRGNSIVENVTGVATNNAMSVASNDPRKLSTASNKAGGRRKTRRRASRRN